MTHNVRASHYEVLEKENERLRERERELCARVERMREAIEEHRMGCDEECVCTEDEMLWSVLDEAPAQSLREIRAEAGREGFVEGWRASRSIAFGSDLQDRWNIPEEKADEYAQQIREGKE